MFDCELEGEPSTSFPVSSCSVASPAEQPGATGGFRGGVFGGVIGVVKFTAPTLIFEFSASKEIATDRIAGATSKQCEHQGA